MKWRLIERLDWNVKSVICWLCLERNDDNFSISKLANVKNNDTL